MPSIDVLDSTISYLDHNHGDHNHGDHNHGDHDPGSSAPPVVFLHGNPASSHVWRKVLHRIGLPARLLAPDLIGMGRSGKPDSDYRFGDHARYLDAWFDALGLDRVVLVGHDWGGALALDHATRHPDRVLGVAFFETVLKPMSWGDLPPGGRERFQLLRTPGVGEQMVLQENDFITVALPRTTATPLDPADLAVYAEPYPTPQSRRPLLTWARSMPMDGDPPDVLSRVEAYDQWLGSTPEVPKLLLTFAGHPSLMIGDAMVGWCREHVAGLEVEACGVAGHIAQEDRPDEIAAAITGWALRHGLSARAGHRPGQT